MRNAILLQAALFLLLYMPGATAAPAGEIAGLGKRLQAFVSAAVRGNRAEAQSILARDAMFRPLRDSGDIATFEAFLDRQLPAILADHYPGQQETEIVPLTARIHADSFGTFHLMAKFYPAPALFTFSVYKQRDAWWVLNMRFINGAEDVAGEVASLGPTAGQDLAVASSPASRYDLDGGPREPHVAKANDVMPPAPAAAAERGSLTVAKGVEAYRRQEYGRAFAIWQRLAGQGVRKAQFHLGAMHMEGRLDRPDRVQAYIWLRRAELAGYGEALALLTALVPQMSGAELAEARRQMGRSLPAYSESRSSEFTG